MYIRTYLMKAFVFGILRFNVSYGEVILLTQQKDLNCSSVNRDDTKVNLTMEYISQGIAPLLHLNAKYKKLGTQFFSLLTPQHERVLEAVDKHRIFKLYKANKLEVLPGKQEEHIAYYQEDCNNVLVNLMVEFELTRLSIIVHKNCKHFTVEALTSLLNKNDLKYFCREMHEDQELKGLPQLVDNAEIVLLLLSPFDANIMLEKMMSFEVNQIIFVTTEIPDHIFRKMKSIYNGLKLINLVNGKQGRLILNGTGVKKIAEGFELKQTDHVIPSLGRYFDPKNYSCIKPANADISFPGEYWRVVSVIYEPFCILLSFKPVNRVCALGILCHVPRVAKNETLWEMSCCSGMGVELFGLIAREWNIRFELYIVEDGKFGGLNNGTWNGIINDVYSGKADVGVQGIIPTVERSRVVDFTAGFINSQFAIIRRKKMKEKLGFLNWKFLEPIDHLLLIIIFLTAVIIQIAIFLFENVKMWVLTAGRIFSFQDAFSYTIGLVFQRDIGGDNPMSSYGRVTALFFAVSMTVVMTTYTATLTANGITNPRADEFKGLSDPKITNPSRAFSFGTMINTNVELFFKHHPANYFRKVYNFMKEYSVASDEEGVKAVVSGDLDAYISDSIYTLSVTSQAKYCSKVTTFKDNGFETEVAFVTQKNSTITKRLTLSILKFKESGEIDRLYEKWVYAPECKELENEDNRFGFEYFGGLVMVVACSVLTCMSIHMIEHFYSYLKSK